MIGLNLSSRVPFKLPASTFPERAQMYVCDLCGRDITSHFHPPQSHTSSPIGPMRCQCACGQKYLTGATEWDYLGDGDRSRRVKETLFLGLLFSGLVGIFLGLPAYIFLRFLMGLSQTALIAALALTSLPFVLLQGTFWPQVVASIWRTRVKSNIER